MSDGRKIKNLWTIDTIDPRTRIILNRQHGYNVITDAGIRTIIARAIGNNGGKYFTHGAIGEGSRQENQGDTDLETPVDNRVPISTHGDASAYSSTMRISVRFSRQGTDRNITEFGLFDAATGGNLLARITTQSPAQLTTTRSVTATITMQIAET